MESKPEKESNKIIKNTENKQLEIKLWIIFKFILGVIVLLLIAYKIFTEKISISVGNIDYTILLSFLLAFFSIVLSMMFYFKSNDSSNQFYDNTYKFTKDISTILGRIEAGFGEKLQNLDKGYSGLLDKFDRKKIPTEIDLEETKLDKKELQKNLATEYKERNEIVKNLLEKSQLDNVEKDKISSQLKEKEKVIFELGKEISELQNRLNKQENLINYQGIPPMLINFLKKRIVEIQRDNKLNQNNILTISSIKNLFEMLKPTFNRIVFRELTKFELINEDEELTRKGIKIFRSILNEI